RPKIQDVDDSLHYGGSFTIDTDQAASIAKGVTVRNPALTHLRHGDQRPVELPILARHGGSLTVAAPPTSAVAPAGPYMLFIDRKQKGGGALIPAVAAPGGRGRIPPVGGEVSVGGHGAGPVHHAAVVGAPAGGAAAASSSPASAVTA